ncbi:MAG: hypothetical protein H7144_13690 [Burkholderiales bacterium]|nr:hypothetical protein [Phycisphaerae bacterium]
MELSAQAEGSSDALQLDPSDLADDLSVSKPLIPHAPRKTVAGLDARLFDALVAPQVPVVLIPQTPADEPASPSPVSPVEAAVPIEPPPVVLKMGPADSAELPDVPTPETDWEPLPPHMWIGPTPDPVEIVDEADHDSSALDIAPFTAPVPASFETIPAIEQLVIVSNDTAAPRKYFDPAAIEPEEDIEAELQIEIDEPDEDADDADDQEASQFDPKMPEIAESTEEAVHVYSGRTGAWWSIPMLCAGVAIVACALLVPAADANRRAAHELAQIDQDVAYFERQSDVNKEFLERVSTDPTLAERLAMRQLRLTRADARIVDVPRKQDAFSMSPYALVAVEPPAALSAYRPIGGVLAKYFLNTKGQIYLAGLGVLLAAAGVILGGGSGRNAECRVSNVE